MALLLTLLLTAQSLAAPGISGVVRDSSGQVVPGATVIARFVNGSEQQTVSGPDGRFSLAIAAPGDVVLVVRAQSFSELKRTLAPGATTEVTVVLSPASLSETVTVTASRMEQRLRDVPASVTVLRQEDIRRSPAVVADDVLRQIPTFSLFRRTSSLASHPTAQGVSLRGIGPSGVSRTLVLLDGVPFNDPFGGWVYWTRVPLDAADRIEVVDRSSSSLYGNYAMGGVINIMTAAAMRRTVEVKAQYGNRNSPKVDFRASDVWGKLGAGARRRRVFDRRLSDRRRRQPGRRRGARAGRQQRVGGVPQLQREGRLRRDATTCARSFAPATSARSAINGKASTIDGTDEKNDTSWTSVSGGVRAAMGSGGELQAALFTDFETFRSNFLAVPAATPPRSIGRMTLNQRVPSNARRRHGAVVASIRRPAVLQRRHRLALGRRRQRGRRARRDDRHAGDAAAHLGRHAAQPRRCSSRTSSRRSTSLTLTLSARVDTGATTTATISRRRSRAACRPPTTPRRCPSATTRCSARASPRSITSPSQ